MGFELLNNNLDYDKLSKFSEDERKKLCSELRDKIISTVSSNGGHLASNLGAVELTVALLSVFDYKKDKILFDVGHQSYSYKLLTGRYDEFDTLRTKGGISGFQRITESPYDVFDTGHSSTSISAALGMARARDLNGDSNYIVAVIGDGAMTGGLSYEALNDLGHSKTPMLVILNDNEMSIDKNVGGLSRYLKKLRVSKQYISAKHSTERFLNKEMPIIGKPIIHFILRIKNFFRFLVNKQQPSMFEDLGLLYYGPIDGHDTQSLIDAMTAVKDLKAPVLMHVCTKKGKGYEYAEKRPWDYHGVGPFDVEKGVVSSSKSTFTSVFGEKMVELGEKNSKVIGITAAMSQGTGLDSFASSYPDRFFDCGIAEEHAVTMAAGLARSGFVPVVAIYSSFLQRAYDQMIHDVCFMNNHVIFAVDRAGFVGNDGHTHHGLLDISYFNSMQEMCILAPRDYDGLKMCFDYAVENEGPFAIRYPRGSMNDNTKPTTNITKPELLCDNGNDFAIISVGRITSEAKKAFDILGDSGKKGKLIHITMIKPLPVDDIIGLLGSIKNVYTVEEGIVSGGFGERLSSELIKHDSSYNPSIFAVENAMVRAASVEEQLIEAQLDGASIASKILTSLS